MSIFFPKNDNGPPPKSINEGNWPSLLTVLIANLAVFGLFVANFAPEHAALMQKLTVILPAGIGLILVRVANGQLSADQKDFLVMWGPLPGFEAFSKYALNDKRVKPDKLKKKLNVKSFPTKPKDQNELWFEFYYRLEDKPSVMQANRNFLFTRDYTGISFLLLILLGAAAFYIAPPMSAAWYVLGMIIQYVLVSHAAKNYAVEVVVNVLALVVVEPSVKIYRAARK